MVFVRGESQRECLADKEGSLSPSDFASLGSRFTISVGSSVRKRRGVTCKVEGSVVVGGVSVGGGDGGGVERGHLDMGVLPLSEFPPLSRYVSLFHNSLTMSQEDNVDGVVRASTVPCGTAEEGEGEEEERENRSKRRRPTPE